MPRDSSELAALRLQRVDGAARLVYARREGGSYLSDLYQRAPCRVLFPTPDLGEPPQAVLLTTSGGLTGGDRLNIAISVGDGASATITSQAAEKLYRSVAGDCGVDISVSVGEGAWAEWLMQETILFNGARLRRRTVLDVAPGGRLLAVESVVFGRTAMGEDFQSGFLLDGWRVRRAGRLIWADALRLKGDIVGERHRPFGFGGAVAAATVLYVADDADSHLDAARSLVNETVNETPMEGGTTSFDGLLLIRLLSPDAAALRRAVIHTAAGLRAAVGGLPARLPRVWYC